ncbi:FAD-binding oxidoreductase [Phytoactinopolyspora halotolerans]|uniref:FAD-binding oxidoreductase n=1 Tax=Phytoactinopolyspora halotolerans TaxID=1981512 RepID=A0A6L9S7V8_9ACTN|nr:FAD-binding oxidoreductase [Phytoactinopolyspora halotolerans]NEE01073.1 FAD-binding oxidoreductase [Phytoactinopolyspora halotolerans]
MPDLSELSGSLDGQLFRPDSAGYEAVRRPVNSAYGDVRPRLVVLCRSVSDVARTVTYATATGDRVASRGGGHCFAGRSSTDGIVLDLSGLDGVSVADDGTATIGAGARLRQVYAALHAHGLTLPAGCGPTVGITGLTLGGGIGLLGRIYGLTCDRLVGAQVVLADGSVVDCDDDHEPDLFWGLRGAGGGQFGVVTSLRFDTVGEPITTRIQAHWPDFALHELVSGWQAWAPDVPAGLTLNLTLVSDAGAPIRATLFGASTLTEESTRDLLRGFVDQVGTAPAIDVRPGLPYHHLKDTFADPRDAPVRAPRLRSEFFSRPMAHNTLGSLLTLLDEARPTPGRREITFTAMGAAYNSVAEDATAFAHRSERFLLEHIADESDPWVDASWATAHADGSGRVYPNFPDPALNDWATAYHARNYPRLAAVKYAYDPHRFFGFPQAI